jgi:hypothetical protein
MGWNLRPSPGLPSGRASPAHIISCRPCFGLLFSGRARAGPKSPTQIPSTSSGGWGMGLTQSATPKGARPWLARPLGTEGRDTWEDTMRGWDV